MKCIESLRRVVLAAVFVATVTPLVAQDRISWITDLRQAREAAERQQRLVLLHFWSDDCVPCKQIERNVFNQPEFIRALTTGYIPVKINAAQQPQLANFYNIERVPTDVIVTPEGREVHRFQSLQDSNQYIAMLDGIRAQASIGIERPAAPTSIPVSTPTQQETATPNPSGSYATNPPSPSRYEQSGYGPAAAPPATSAPAAKPAYTQNRYTNPLDQQAPSEQRELAPRYANPYAQQTVDNDHTGGSRWTPPTQGYTADTPNQAQQPTAPQANTFAGPAAAPAWQQPGISPQNQPMDHRVASNPAPQNSWTSGQPASSGQPTPQASTGGPATPPRYDVGGQPQPPVTQTQRPAAQPQPPIAQPQPTATGQPSISLDGYCPVTLVHNRIWTPGDKKWGAVHEGRVYLFAGPEQQQQFLANPAIYAPLMAGYDPVRFAETGQLVPGRREFGLYIDEPGPIALFADEAALERFHANSGYYFNVIRQARLQQTGGAAR